MKEIMTPEQVAEYLQLNKDTVHRLIRDKRMAATRIGRSYRIPREDLEAFLVANSTREAVRQAFFRRVSQIAERNPDVNSDAVLEELEHARRSRTSRKNA